MLGNNCWYVVYELLRLLRNLHHNVAAAAAAAKIDSRCTRSVAVESLRRSVAVAVGAAVAVALKIGSLDARLVTSNIARDDKDRPCPLLRNGCW